MSRNSRLNARCTAAEKDLLVQVAQAMQRTPSDTLRFLVYEKAQALGITHTRLATPQISIIDTAGIRKSITAPATNKSESKHEDGGKERGL